MSKINNNQQIATFITNNLKLMSFYLLKFQHFTSINSIKTTHYYY